MDRPWLYGQWSAAVTDCFQEINDLRDPTLKVRHGRVAWALPADIVMHSTYSNHRLSLITSDPMK